jgi:hypothetical protein
MKTVFVVPTLLLCAALHSSAWAVDQANVADLPCAGAVAWLHAHPEESDEAMARRDAERTLTDPALRAELDARVKKDQDARTGMLRGDVEGRAVVAIDKDNIKWLYALVTTRGFPTAAQVGERGVQEAWLLAQHADLAPRFQADLLPLLELRHREGELNASDLSRFTDRVLKAQGKPQRYGTQFPPEEWATAHFGLPSDEAVREVDANRRTLGVMPLADYVCMMSYLRRPR